MGIHQVIQEAESILPWREAPAEDEDPRWQSIIAINQYIDTDPKEVWDFVRRWGSHEDEDLRMAIATCLLEHLLETHFNVIFPLAEQTARSNRIFADTLSKCWKLGQAATTENAKRIERLLEETDR